MPDTGKLIAIEGPDRIALVAQSERLCRWLQERDIAVQQIETPTRGPVGALLRLHQQGRLHFDPASLALVWMADRTDLVGRVDGLRTWLERGDVVVCARYLMHAYATLIDHVDLEWLRQIDARCIPPHLTLYIEAPAPGRWADRYERVVDALQGEGQRVLHISGTSQDDIERACRQHIAALLDRAEES